MNDNQAARKRFEQFANGDEELDVLEVALLIAAEEYPDLDTQSVRKRFSEMSLRLQSRISECDTELARARELVSLIHGEEAFTGNEGDYYNPDNSFINVVVDTRRGIPLTLAIVHMVVGNGAGLVVKGLNTPSHFLIQVGTLNTAIVDPFSGKILSEAGFRERLKRTLQLVEAPDETVVEHFRAPSTPRDIARRMLSNLKHIYLSAEQAEKALGVCERLLMLVPEDPDELLQRGYLYQHLECVSAAVKDFEKFLNVAPGHAAAERVRMALGAIKRQAATLH